MQKECYNEANKSANDTVDQNHKTIVKSHFHSPMEGSSVARKSTLGDSNSIISHVYLDDLYLHKLQRRGAEIVRLFLLLTVRFVFLFSVVR